MDASLGASLDALGVVLKDIEAELYRSGLVSRGRVAFGDETSAGIVHYLAFGKLANEYRLILETWKDGEMTDQAPLANVSYEYRLRAVDLFDALYAELRQVLDKEQSRAAVTVEKACTFLLGIKK